MKNEIKTPVLLIIFNRPDKVSALIGSLSKVKPLYIYISADGPRENVPSDKIKCDEARKVAQEINWPCEIHTNFYDKNLGVDIGMEKAMSWFFSNVEEGIICEDDCIPHSDFFRFTSELLERYRSNKKVMLISGTNFQDNIKRGEASYYFSNYPTWGYAMWRRTWEIFDSNLSGLDEFIKENKIDTILKNEKQKKYWVRFFKQIRSKKYNFTDTRLLFSIWNNNGLTIIPNRNIVKNIGFDIEATHSTTGGEERSIDTESLGGIINDDTFVINREADDYFFNKIHEVSIYKKILYELNQLINKIKKNNVDYMENLKKIVIKLRRMLLTDVGMNNGSDRQQWIINSIKKIPAGGKILDAGAGECQFKEVCKHLSYTSQDFGQYNGTGDSKGIQMKKWDNTKLDLVSDITKIPVPDCSFDIILCTEVFEHIPDPISAIKEFSRILKTGGQLILTAPFCSMTHFAPYHFYSGFNKYFYETHLKNNGFEIKELRSNGSFFDFVAQDIKTLPSIVEGYTGKTASLYQKLIMVLMLRVLKKYKTHDINSSELLCFGYQVIATKK